MMQIKIKMLIRVMNERMNEWHWWQLSETQKTGSMFGKQQKPLSINISESFIGRLKKRGSFINYATIINCISGTGDATHKKFFI